MAPEFRDGIDVIAGTELLERSPWTADEARVLAWFDGTAYLDLGHVCNQSCRYCWQGADLREALPLAQVSQKLALVRREGLSRVILIGGEPLVHPEFFSVLKLLREAGIARWGLMTNGIRLAEPGFLDRLVTEGLSYCQFSFDSPRPQVQNALAGNPGLFDALMASFKALAAHPQLPFDLSAVITRENADHLAELVDFAVDLRDKAGLRPVLAFTRMKPVAEPENSLLYLDDAAAAAALRPALVAAHQARLPVFVRNLPQALLGEFAARSSDSLVRVIRVV